MAEDLEGTSTVNPDGGTGTTLEAAPDGVGIETVAELADGGAGMVTVSEGS